MIDYKTAGLQDIETLQNLARNIWTISYSEMLSPEQIEYMLNWMYSAETIRKEITDGVLWELIELDNKNVGFISLTPENEKLKLNKLYILPNIQGKGIGQSALQHVVEYAKEHSYKEVYLTVNKGNSKAIKAYRKAGFKCTDSKIFDIGGGYVMDDYIYSYYL